jgi:hypothetical protein
MARATFVAWDFRCSLDSEAEIKSTNFFLIPSLIEFPVTIELVLIFSTAGAVTPTFLAAISLVTY